MALEAAERRMSELLEDLQLIVVIVRPNGEISFCNHHLYQLTGWQPSDVIGENWVDLMIPDGDRDRVRAAIASINTDLGLPVHFESPMLGPEGERRWIAWDSIIMRDCEGSNRRAANVGRDITDFKKLEGQFQQAQKLESIGRLAGGVAHDFNNLLTVIRGQSDVVLAKSGPLDDARTVLNEVRKAADKGAELTQRLLAFSRRRVLRLEVRKSDQPDRGRRVHDPAPDWRTHPTGHRPRSVAGPGERGYWPPASDHAEPGSERAGRDAAGWNLDDFHVQRNRGRNATGEPATVSGNFVQLTVADTGTGMSEEVRNHMFEPFYTTKASGKGTGLGLVHGIRNRPTERRTHPG